jgi:hypothetical protein
MKVLSEVFALIQSSSLPRRSQTDEDGPSELGPDEFLSFGPPAKLLEIERLESQETKDFLFPAPQFPGIPASRHPSFPASWLFAIYRYRLRLINSAKISSLVVITLELA